MKFTIKREILDKAISKIDAIVPARDLQTLLSNLLVTLAKDEIHVTVSDMETTVRISCEAICSDTGEFIVPAKKFGEMVRSILSKEITITVNKNENADENSFAFEVQINGTESTSAAYSLPGNTTKHFPNINRISDSKLSRIPAALFDEMIKKSVYSISQEDNRYIYNGLCINAKGETITIIGTDGRRLAAVSRKLSEAITFEEGADVVVHAKAIRELQKLIDGSDEVQIGIEQRDIFMKVGDAQLSSRLLEGKFPDYQKVLPQHNSINLEFNREKLLNALSQMKPISEAPSYQCRFTLENNELLITAQSTGQASRGSAKIPADYNGEKMEIGFNILYMLDILKALTSNHVKLSMNDSNKPIVVHDLDDADFIALVMPMKI